MLHRMGELMGERLAEDMFGCVAESRENFRKLAKESKPPSKLPHSFDADARHDFDQIAEHAESLGLSCTVDRLTDAIARGKLTEVQAHAQLWPSVACATHADQQYTWPHPWRTRTPSLNDAMARYDEKGKFSLAKQLEVLINPRWESLKDRGNDALKAGEPMVAVMWYKRAESLTDVNNALTAFFKVLHGAPATTAAARLANAEEDFRDVIFRFLPDGPRAIVPFDAEGVEQAPARGEPAEGSEPNLPRAVCLGNAAAALLKAGKPQAALEEALDAAAFCPEYVKAYHRQAAALKAVGKANESAQVEEDLCRLEYVQARMTWNGINLLALQWLGSLAYEQIYGPAYCAHECAKIAALKKPVTVLASLVPLTGGQWLTIGVQYRSLGASVMEGGSPDRRHDCMHMAQLDDQNGDIVEAPPHGRASRASIERFPVELIKFLRKLRGASVEPKQLCLGQGLAVFERGMKKRLKAAGFEAVTTYTASVTHASKVQEMGVEAACGIELDADGNVVGMRR